MSIVFGENVYVFHQKCPRNKKALKFIKNVHDINLRISDTTMYFVPKHSPEIQLKMSKKFLAKIWISSERQRRELVVEM